jgi:hypothetical protein
MLVTSHLPTNHNLRIDDNGHIVFKDSNRNSNNVDGGGESIAQAQGPRRVRAAHSAQSATTLFRCQPVMKTSLCCDSTPCEQVVSLVSCSSTALHAHLYNAHTLSHARV